MDRKVKVFEVFEDFERACKDKEVGELFYRINMKQEEATEMRQAADGRTTTVKGARTEGNLELTAVSRDGSEMLYFANPVGSIVIASEEDAGAFSKMMKDAVDAVVLDFQKVYPSCRLIRGRVGF